MIYKYGLNFMIVSEIQDFRKIERGLFAKWRIILRSVNTDSQ
jgi:hypothetical protein